MNRIKPGGGTKYILLLIVISLSVTFFCQYPSLKNQLIIPSDVNMYVFPTYYLQDQGLFKDDIITSYALSRMPWGYTSTILFLSYFCNPVFLIKVLPFFLMILSVVYLFMFAKQVCGDQGAFLTTILFIFHSWTFQSFQGTAPRAFAYPFVIVFLYCLYNKKYVVGLIFFVLQILFYPPIAAISLATFLISLVNIRLKKKEIYLRYPLKLSIILIICFPLFYFLQFRGINSYETLDFNTALKMPEFYPKGRSEFFFCNIKDFLESSRSGIGLNDSLILLSSIFLLLWFFNKVKKNEIILPKEVFGLFISSFLLYIAAYILFFHLFFPGRYLIFTLPLALCIFIGILFGSMENTFRKNPQKHIFLIAFCIPLIFFYIPKISGKLVDYRYLEDVISILSVTEKNSLIASTPNICDPIPTFAKRKVFFNYKLLLPFHRQYYEEMKVRVFDFYDAYYAVSSEKIKTFCSEYSIDYIIFSKSHFTDNFLQNLDEHDDMVEPFSSYIRKITKYRHGFILPKLERKNIFFEKNGIVVVRTVDLFSNVQVAHEN